MMGVQVLHYGRYGDLCMESPGHLPRACFTAGLILDFDSVPVRMTGGALPRLDPPQHALSPPD